MATKAAKSPVFPKTVYVYTYPGETYLNFAAGVEDLPTGADIVGQYDLVSTGKITITIS